jgi:hypothetical protein
MPPPDRTAQLLQVPLQHLIMDLLRQFNKPSLLGKRGIDLNKAALETLAEQLANHAPLPASVQALNDALLDIVQESVAELQTRFGLTFAQALAKTDMGDMGGWETTAEFLDIANHKYNAELRIAAGTALMVFLGDTRLVAHLLTVIEHDKGLDDVDALIAKRALSHHTQIALDADDWEAQVRAVLE